jgi:precorrin-4/cobalt-precorrin-4 C11-methyltransferase
VRCTGCPAAIVAHASWPEEQVIAGTLGTLVAQHAAQPVQRTALILVGPALGPDDFRESALYDADYVRRFRGQA